MYISQYQLIIIPFPILTAHIPGERASGAGTVRAGGVRHGTIQPETPGRTGPVCLPDRVQRFRALTVRV